MIETNEQLMARRNLILYCRTGSHMYGTSTPESDVDHTGIFIPDMDYVIGLKRCEQVEFKTNPSSSGKRNGPSDKDETIYSLPKYLHLASMGNPNILEIMFSSQPDLNTPVWFKPFGEELVANRNKFLTEKVRKTFLGYAYAQKDKLLVKKTRLGAIRRAQAEVFDSEINADGFIKEGIYVRGENGNVYHTFETGSSIDYVIDQLNKMEAEYGLRTKSIEDHGFDTKFAMHLIRLLREGLDILEGRGLRFPLPYAEELLQVRRGEIGLDTILLTSDQLIEKAENIKTNLPDHCDMEWLNNFQVRMLTKFWDESGV